MSTQSVPDFALTIVQQLGGRNKLKAMIAAHNLSYSREESSLSFRFKGSRECNHLKIILNPNDLYSLQFWKVPTVTQMLDGKGAMKEPTIVCQENDIFCDQLIEVFERVTGLYLHL